LYIGRREGWGAKADKNDAAKVISPNQ